jgi:hypothetical protein
MKRWNPPQDCTPQEQALLGRLVRTRKLFGFLRLQRHVLFDEGFQAELAGMYRQSGAGEEPVPPALLCMALLLQGYTGTSDAEAVEASVVDLRWQLVLGRLGEAQPAFAQGTLQQFRERLIRHDMDRRLLERTVQVARARGGFDPKKLPKSLRLAVDSRPLKGAGRVEDTFNLLGHAARLLVRECARLTGQDEAAVCRSARCPLFGPQHKSLKAALDIDWSDEAARAAALTRVCAQLQRLEAWLKGRALDAAPRVVPALTATHQVRAQDTECTSSGDVRVRRGTAPGRRVSLEDPDMRHGRKSSASRFDGYKAHVASDLDTPLVLACALLPANRPEAEAAPLLEEDLAHQPALPPVGELHVDRAYPHSTLAQHVRGAGGLVVCKPRSARGSPGLFTRAHFRTNPRGRTLTCPAGHAQPYAPGRTVRFPDAVCAACPLRSQCTRRKDGKGRTLLIARDEEVQRRFRALQRTRTGRARLRERVHVEHALAHLAARQGRRARYRGTRKNLFDLRRAASLQNLEALQHQQAA